MKILELRFKNLNSLYGEWLIDFTAPEYTSNGIFALTGPTGAGKSTILDAICLALYGATPRLGKITKSGNEIMSRQTGECFSEVTFEAQSGVYKCHWSQHRARKNPEGKLAESKHEIADADSGQILESKKRDVANVIEEKTGMDFDRFTRSILLAQGGFDTFLKADVEQKSKVLEQITGTEIYSQISMRVHERRRDERTELERLQAEISGINILSGEQEIEISQELTEKQKSEIEISKQLKETKEAIHWLTIIIELKSDIATFSEQDETLNQTLESFKAEREKLARAQKAAELDGEYATLSTVRQQQADDQVTLQEENNQLPEIQKSVLKKEEYLKVSEQAFLKSKEEQKSQAPVIQKVRILDQQISDRKKSSEIAETDYKTFLTLIEDDKTLSKTTNKQLEIANNDLKLVHDYLKTNASDEFLVTQLAGIEEQLNNLNSIQEDISKNKAHITKTKKELDIASKTLKTKTKELVSTQEQSSHAQKQVTLKKNDLADLLEGRHLREYRFEKETLLREMTFLKKIEDLEAERNNLEDHKPCPLCGSEEHPYAIGNIPEIDETEHKINTLSQLITEAEQFEQLINDLEIQEKQAADKVVSIEKREADAINGQKNAENALSDIMLEFTRNNQRSDDLKQVVLEKLELLGINKAAGIEDQSLLLSLKARLSKWQKQQNKSDEIEKHQSELKSELNKLDAVIESQTNTLDEKNKALNTIKKEYKAQVLERNELFGSKDPVKEQARLEIIVSEADSVEKTARFELDGVKQTLNSTKVRISTLNKEIDERSSQLQTLESSLVSTLQFAGFSDEAVFLAHRLSVEERERLIAKAKELDDQKTKLQANKKDRENRLDQEMDKKVTELTLDELQPRHEKLEDTSKLIINTIAGLKHQLTDNEIAKKKIKEKQGSIDAQKNECSKWDKLHGLIGSADGKRYRNFAQGLTFELMVSHANRQLEKMTDRYLLIRDDDEPLELNVVDNYQAGEIRSTKNLSGGESFIVSLTLALGLSKMASHKVRVDSLFLDEGFGTLDEDALETALETLSGLQQDGKLIGIISHVSALKERISTQINVSPVSGGKSSISGPGCMMKNETVTLD